MLSFYWVDHRKWKRLQKSAGEYQRRLGAQQIVPGNPGTILRDIDVLLDFVGRDGIVTKSRNSTFPAERLPALNAAVGHPIELALTRPLLRDYPNLAGLYILLRVMDLLQTKANRLVVDPRALEFWRTLNPTEQYFALLEALLFEAQTTVLGGERRPREAPANQAVPVFLSHLTEQWREFDSYEAAYDLGPKGTMPTWNVFAQQQLGLIEIRQRTPSAEAGYSSGGRGWLVGRARLTPWGVAATWALLDLLQKKDETEAKDMLEEEASEQGDLFEMLDPDSAPSADSDEESENEDPNKVQAENDEAEVEEAEDSVPGAGFGILQPAFQPFFKEWQTIYRRPEREARPGIHIFKVSLGRWRGSSGVWRRLAVPPDNSLDQLASAILDAFKFDEDHLYDFCYRDQRGKQRVYNHPGTEEGPFTDQVAVGQLELALKDEMLFTFDYGDNWQFTVRLESVEAPDVLRRPGVIASAGKAPEQYPGGG